MRRAIIEAVEQGLAREEELRGGRVLQRAVATA
jgi:hypothetical protein